MSDFPNRAMRLTYKIEEVDLFLPYIFCTLSGGHNSTVFCYLREQMFRVGSILHGDSRVGDRI